jgi:phosphopantothenoylcysteine decarboxylase/phosphopantothenate--cysteine ligase
MSVLSGKKVLLGISGVAAYKTASLVRLIKAGAHVQVIMTPASKDFVTLHLSTLKNAVHSTLIRDEKWNNHVELGLWADIIITSYSNIYVEDGGTIILLLLYLQCPVYLSLDLDMYKHPSTYFANLEIL